MELTSLLKSMQLFRGLSQEELADVAAICREVQKQPGELIIEQNTTGKEMYVIAAGSVDVFITGLDDARTLVMLGQGQVVGEMALIDQGYRSASVRANEVEVTLYQIDNDAFYDLCRQNNHIGFIVMRNLAIGLAFKLRHSNLAKLM